MVAMSEPDPLPIELHREYFLQKLRIDERILSEGHFEPSQQRYIDIGKRVLGPKYEAGACSPIAIIFDLQNTLVPSTFDIFEVYRSFLRNPQFRNDSIYRNIKRLVGLMMHALTDYSSFRVEVSEELRKTQLERDDHVTAAKKTAKQAQLAPNSQSVCQTFRRTFNAELLIDTADFHDIGARIGSERFGIPSRYTKATHAVFDGKNKFKRLDPNIKDDKLKNKKLALQDLGIDADFSVYIADVTIDKKELKKGIYRIVNDDPEINVLGKTKSPNLPISLVAGFERGILSLGIGLKNVGRDVFNDGYRRVRRAIGQSNLETESDEYVFLGDQYPRSCVVLSTCGVFDLRKVINPFGVWTTNMAMMALTTPETHFHAMQGLHRIDEQASKVINAPPSTQKQEAEIFSKMVQTACGEFFISLPVFESGIKSQLSELEELISQDPFNVSRFSALSDEINPELGKVVEKWYTKKDKSLLGDYANRYAERFRGVS
jgi:hypothetical protein